MKQITTCSIFLIFITLNIFPQNSLDDLNIVFKHDFENNTLGNYLVDEWKSDWLSPTWNSRLSETDIVRNTNDNINPTKSLQINFPANSLGSSEGGTSWEAFIDKKNELYISYDLYFMPGFQYQMGGKLPSVKGGTVNPGIVPTGYDGFTGGLMFKEDGQIVFYVYFPDSKATEYGDSYPWGRNYPSTTNFLPSSAIMEYGSGTLSKCKPGEWHNITYRMVLNTINSEGRGNYDGILEAYFDGKLVTQVSHLLFRHTADLGIDCMRIYSFFGGSTDDWRNPISEWLRIDNVMLYTFKSNINVPRGNTLSPTNRTINYWRKIINGSVVTLPLAPSNVSSANITINSATIKWTDNSNNEDGFEIYRSSSATEGFVKIGITPANATEFNNSSLDANATYYYKILAFNSVGKSAFTPVFSLTTLPDSIATLPLAPSNVTSANISKNSATIKWTDNSSNESGFQIQRAINNGNFTILRFLESNQTTFVDNDIEENITYSYRIRAFNIVGYSNFSNTLNIFITPQDVPPGAPINFNSPYIGSFLIELEWADMSNNENGFELYRADSTLLFNRILSTEPDITQYTDTSDIQPLSVYYYLLRAFNDFGYSAFSDTVRIFTYDGKLPAPPSSLDVSDINTDNISLKWRDNSYNEQGFIIKRAPYPSEDFEIIYTTSPNLSSYVDSYLELGVTYLYTVSAINEVGESDNSNEIRISSPTLNETLRVKDGLIAEYNFSSFSKSLVPDRSGFDIPLDLEIRDPDKIDASANGKLKIISGTLLNSLGDALKISNACKFTNEITVECWLKTNSLQTQNTSKILSLENNSSQAFSLNVYTDAQNPDKIIYSTNLRTTTTDDYGRPELILNETLDADILQHIVFTHSNSGNEKLYVNGEEMITGYRPANYANWENDYSLLIANNFYKDSPWLGDIYLLAVYDRSLSPEEIFTNYLASPFSNLDYVLNSHEYKLHLYPNPANNFVTLILTNPEGNTDITERYFIKILDIYGKVLYTEDITSTINLDSVELNISSLNSGVYLVVLYNRNEVINTQKLLILD